MIKKSYDVKVSIFYKNDFLFEEFSLQDKPSGYWKANDLSDFDCIKTNNVTVLDLNFD